MPAELTTRQKIKEALKGSSLTAKEISRAVGITEKDVLSHLPHVARSASRGRHGEETFIVVPSTCLECGFVFRKRSRLKTPSRCPVCSSEEITEMRFGMLEE